MGGSELPSYMLLFNNTQHWDFNVSVRFSKFFSKKCLLTAYLNSSKILHFYFLLICRENKNLTGTARYASVNTHLGIGKANIFSPLLSTFSGLKTASLKCLYF